MFFVKEIVAFLQLTVMPGLLLLAIIRPKLGRFRSFLLIPGLSLLLNYVFVSLTFKCNQFTALNCWIYTALVWGLTLFFMRREIGGFFDQKFSGIITDLWQAVCNSFREMSDSSRKLLVIIAMAGAVIGVVSAYGFWWNAVNEVFAYWDSALSWNFWAECWSMNQYPVEIGYYPQLIPKNWALVYKLIGNTICFVPKAAVSIFPLLIVLMFFEYGIVKRRLEMLLAIPLFIFYFNNVGYISHGGELDLVMAYYGTAVFFLVNYAGEAEKSGTFFRRLWLAVMIIAAAGVTKQAGLFLILAFAVLVPSMLHRKFAELHISWKKMAVNFLAMAVFTVLLTAPEYIAAEQRIAAGIDYSNTQLVTHDIYGGKNLFERFVCSVRFFTLKLQCGISHIRSARYAVFDLDNGFFTSLVKLYKEHIPLGMIMLALNIFLLYGCWKDRRIRGIAVVSLTFTVIWSMFFCYDLRNLSLMIPALGLLAASGIVYYSGSVFGKKVGNMNLRHGIIAGIVIFLLGYLMAVTPGQRRINYVEKVIEVGDRNVNKGLAKYYEEYISRRKAAGLPDKKPVVLTDYAYIKLLETYRTNWRNCNFSVRGDAVFEQFCTQLETPEITAILVPRYADKRIWEHIESKVKKGELIRYSESNEYVLFVKPFDR